MPAVNFKELDSERSGENSQTIRRRVQKARQIQLQRYKNEKTIFCNADMQSKQIRKYCKLDDDSRELLKSAITKLGLSARAYDRILKVSRTIADIAGQERILPEHISEAIQYRSLDRDLWM